MSILFKVLKKGAAAPMRFFLVLGLLVVCVGCGSTKQKTETVQVTRKSTSSAKPTSDANLEKQLSKAEDAKMHFGRGRIWFNMGEYDDAIEELTKASELDSEQAEPYVYRGRCWAKKGEKEKSEADFEKAKELGPKEGNSIRNSRPTMHKIPLH